MDRDRLQRVEDESRRCSWATVPGGVMTGNNLVRRKLNFAATTTMKIRVRITSAVDGVARIAEGEAWTGNSGGQFEFEREGPRHWFRYR